MDYIRLKYFKAVAKFENITHAANSLYIPQPSLSKSIAQLEQELGVPLFERTGNRIRINEFGKRFLEAVDKSFSALNAGIREITDLAGLEHGQVAISAAVFPNLPDVFRTFLNQYPDVDLKFFQDRQHDEVYRRLKSGEIDIGIDFLPFEDSDIESILIGQNIYFLLLPYGHSLSGRESIDLSEIANEPFIHQLAMNNMRDLTLTFCKKAGFEPVFSKVTMESSDSNLVSSLVACGCGNAFMPRHWWNRVDTTKTTRLKIEKPLCNQDIWLSYMKGHYLSLAAQAFIQLVEGMLLSDSLYD